MLYFFLILTLLSACFLIAGFIWMIVGSNQAQRRSFQDDPNWMAHPIAPSDEDAEFSTNQTIFQGSSKQTSIEVSYSFKEIKDQLVTGHWRSALPALLTAGGLSGLLFFGSLALFLGLEDKLIGGLILALVIYSLVRILIGFSRA